MRIVLLGAFPLRPDFEEKLSFITPVSLEHPGTPLVNLVFEICKYSQFDVHVLTLHPHVSCDSSFQENGVFFHVLQGGRMRTQIMSLHFVDAIRIAKALRFINPDLVHAFGTEGAYALGGLISGSRTIIYLQGIVSEIVKRMPFTLTLTWLRMYLTQFVERWTIKHAAEFMVETFFGEHFVRTLNRNAKIFKINNLIAPLFFQVRRNEFAAPRTILYVGRVTASKGVFELLSVFITLTESYSDICLEFIGPIHDEAEHVKMRGMVSNAGLGDRVRFEGFQPLEYVVSQYASACMMVYPSHMDTSPNSVYEAMAAGVPVIGTRVGGIPEMINHESTGLLVPVNDPEKLAVAIRYLLDHPEERKRMGKAAKKHMQKVLDPAKYLKAIFSAYGMSEK